MEQLIGLLVACDEPGSIAVNDSGEDKVIFLITDTLEVVGDTDEFLHLTEIFGLDFLEGWTELKLLLSVKVIVEINQ